MGPLSIVRVKNPWGLLNEIMLVASRFQGPGVDHG